MVNNEEMTKDIRKVIENVEKVIVGKTDVVYLSLVALLSSGHLLLEDVPGVGKTMLIKSLAKSIGGTYKRIQFTPDLLPSDITGVSIYNQNTEDFEYRPGPVMTNILLADEINRTSPKSQAALLEAMEEQMVTVDGVSYPLPKPFFVMATQNPIEYEGTFPLPESQLDRFILKISMGYPNQTDEVRILDRFQEKSPLEDLNEVISIKQLIKLQEYVKGVYVEETLKEYIVDIVDATRRDRNVYLGASPRASIALLKTSKSLAFIRGRSFVVPEDIKYLVHSVLGHRIILNSDARIQGYTVEQLLNDILRKVAVPPVINKTWKNSYE